MILTYYKVCDPNTEKNVGKERPPLTDKSERIEKAARQLATQNPFDKISFAEVARLADVHWTAVRKHFNGKSEMRAWLAAEQQKSEVSFADTRTRILDAAARVFSQDGFNRASLERVAADAGLTKGAVYWHFAGKSDLYLALCDRSLNLLLQQFPAMVRYVFRSQDPINALTNLFQPQSAEGGEDSFDVQPTLLYEFLTSTRDPEVKAKLREAFSSLFDGIGAHLEEMQAEGLLNADADPRALAVLFQSLLNGMTQIWLIDPKQASSPSFIHEIARVLWEGMAPKNDR